MNASSLGKKKKKVFADVKDLKMRALKAASSLLMGHGTEDSHGGEGHVKKAQQRLGNAGRRNAQGHQELE